ncbi:MAG TPA: hypothetical protein VHN14_22000 [Kofleriaceae bacterium]|nr:hypothetical protein [Kofleriaceae bacterium]
MLATWLAIGLAIGLAGSAALPGCGHREAARHAPGPALQVLGESSRLRTIDPTPATSPWFDGTRVSLIAARGEILGLQVLHRGGGPVALTFSPRQTAPTRSVQVRGYDVEYFEVRRPSTAMYGGSQGGGSYPDGLSPAPVPATDPAYFEIEIARDVMPGVLDGELGVAGQTFPVALTISPVTLPPLPLRVWAYEDARESIWAGSDERACIAMFRGYGVLLSPDVHLEDWPVRRDQFAGIRDVPVWISDDPVRARDQVKRWIAAFAGTGQVPFAIPIDEPRTPERRRQVRALADVVRAAGGGPTSFRFAVTDTPHEEYGDAIDLYISLSPRLGDRIVRWTYNGAPPAAGSMVLDAEPPGMRTWGWIAWRWQIPIWYAWDALYWHDRHNRKGAPLPGRALDPRRDPVSFNDGEDHGNFDGVLALPGCRPTLRLAALRRGYQDRALLDAAAACDRPAAERVAAELVPRALGDAGATPSWPSDEAAWEAARQKLIALAGCQASSPP